MRSHNDDYLIIQRVLGSASIIYSLSTCIWFIANSLKFGSAHFVWVSARFEHWYLVDGNILASRRILPPNIKRCSVNPPTPLWRWRRAYWGANSYTKCSITFVNIAVAISALAGGGQKRFRTETRIRWCFRHFSRIFGCLSARGYWNGILGHFGSFPAMEKRPKMKKTLYIARFCRVFGCQSIENTAKTSVLDWRYSKKRVNYRMLDWKHYKHSVKSNVLEGFTAFMAKNMSITVCLTGNIGKALSKTMFWKDFLYNIYIYICWSWLPALEHGQIEENTVNSGIFNGWGDKGIGSIVEHDVFDRFYGDKSVK